MKKRLLTLGTLAIAFSVNAQFITYVGNNAQVHVKKDALVYNGGGVKTVGTGVVDNSGNIMIVGGNTSKFVTVDASGNPKTDGGNFILRLTDETLSNLRYGQLYINGLTQANITGIVDKEYKDNAHGTYQQIALPFYGKALSELSTELGKTFGDKRWTQDEILVWNNKVPRFDQLKTTQTTSDATWSVVGRNANTAYYAIGSKTFSAVATKKTVKGVPYANVISETLQNAGKDINFGANGIAQNYYREKYNSYLQDSFDYAKGAWTGNYGRNLYQFGNPFFTNLDLGQLGTVLTNLQGVRVEPTGVTTVSKGSTYSTGAKYITYTSSGTAVGDNNAIIRPMQTFVIKLKDNNTVQTLNFDDLRRFAYTPRAVATPYKVTAMGTETDGGLITMSSSFRSSRSLSSSTVKQLAVVALDVNGVELGRTYYVVYANGVSGQPTDVTTQVIAGNNAIGTFEEAKTGGLDESLKNTYWLYINEANENDFKGKEIPLRIFNKDVKSLKFEIQEDAKAIAKGDEKLSSGESFYINTGDNLITLGNEKSVALTSTDVAFGLYYGKPATTIATEEIKLDKPSSTFVAYDNAENTYKLVFDAEWKAATVQVFDMTGKLVISQKNVNTANPYVITLPIRGTYVVTAVSETGQKFSQKIVK